MNVAVVIFVIFWVVLALVVVFVAMWGGPRRAREALYSEKRAGAGALYAAITAAFVFGLVVPGLVLGFNGEHKAGAGPGGVHLTPAQQTGRRLFAETCAYCHTLQGANAVGRTGPNLDALVPQVSSGNQKNAEAFILSSIESGFAGRYGQMPPSLFQGREAQDVASFVAAVAGR